MKHYHDKVSQPEVETTKAVYSMQELQKESPELYEAKMQAAQERVAMEESDVSARIESARSAALPPKSERAVLDSKNKYKMPLPGGGTWDSLIVVDCRSCRSQLLSPRCEAIRDRAARRDSSYVRMLPPPVGGSFYQNFHSPNVGMVIVKFMLCVKCFDLYRRGQL